MEMVKDDEAMRVTLSTDGAYARVAYWGVNRPDMQMGLGLRRVHHVETDWWGIEADHVNYDGPFEGTLEQVVREVVRRRMVIGRVVVVHPGHGRDHDDAIFEFVA